MRHRSLLLLSLAPLCSLAQVNVPVNGPHERARPVEAFLHATIHPSPGVEWKDATLLIQGDRILAVGPEVKIPAGAVEHDLRGSHLWPALIDPYSDLGLPTREKPAADRPGGVHHWNAAIRSSRDAVEHFNLDEEQAGKLREQGFGTVIAHVQDGIARGTGAAIVLGGRSAQTDVLLPRASVHFSFRKGSAQTDYPSSLMGSIALLRQVFMDASWYASIGHREQSDVDLDAMNTTAALPQVFEASNRNDVLRIAAIGREAGRAFIVKGNGDEYMRLGEVAATGQPLLLPLTLPEAGDVEDPFEALEVSVRDMKHWELAPFNAARLHQAGVRFAFTTRGLKEPGQIWTNLRRMVLCGLDSAAAIAALTTVPAGLFGIGDRCGTLEAGKLASFIITGDHLLAQGNTIHETWVAGQRFAHSAYDRADLRGTYDLNLRGSVLILEVKGERERPEAIVKRSASDSTIVKAELTQQDDLVRLFFDGRALGLGANVRLNGIAHRGSGIWDGTGKLGNAATIPWSAVRQSTADVERRKKKDEGRVLDSLFAAAPGAVWQPFVAYGSDTLPDSTTLVFRRATVWTNGPQGILYDTDVCVHQGKIMAVGKALDIGVLFAGKSRPMVREIDARGRHLTCGIIDEHSHIAIERGVNEGGQAITSEVRVGDVIDPDAIDIYRNLAGGVTTVQQLHGSANPIGGQSSLIKLRWGLSAEAMRIDGAPGFIKFALGENVKQSTSNESSRFPRTRMGVEQIMFDAFHRARTYDSEWTRWRLSVPPPPRKRSRARPLAPPPAPRRDLELEALAEILNGQRFITCHSYVQSEILMLMRLSDSLRFKVNTFTHILEGYKLARKMQEHGVSASTFSDWWAYKVEVYDAIPYNAALLHAAGVNVCINSDDAEMARRLNQEAAKAVKYGGVSEQEAWKMVTLNPAKALRLDHRMGSVEAGKDADLVLWSTNPLSIAAICEMTLVDGVIRFDRERDALLRALIEAERERLIAKMLAAKKAGAPVKKGDHRERRHYHCDTLGE